MLTSAFRDDKHDSKLVSGSVGRNGRADLSISSVKAVKSSGEGEGIIPTSDLMVEASAALASSSTLYA